MTSLSCLPPPAAVWDATPPRSRARGRRMEAGVMALSTAVEVRRDTDDSRGGGAALLIGRGQEDCRYEGLDLIV